MGNSSTDAGKESVYAAAAQWVDRALRTDDSLFTPGQTIWSSPWLGELRIRYLDQPDESSDDFYTKLQRQLEGSPAEVYQLTAELLYVHLLIVYQGSMKGSTKMKRINQVLGWSDKETVIPQDLVDSLSVGVANTGPAFNTLRPFQIGFLMEFAAKWKGLQDEDRKRFLDDPWAFKKFLQFDPTSLLFNNKEGDGSYRAQFQALLHLVFPDTFEAILSTAHKQQIADAFATMVTEPTDDRDHQLAQIRICLEAEHGTGFNYYHEPIFQMWNPIENRKAWDRFIRPARDFVETGQLDSQENAYKVGDGRHLEQARHAVLAGETNWADVLRSALVSNLIDWRTGSKLRVWLDTSPDDALHALQTIWTREPSSVSERVRTFCDLLPPEIGGLGTRTRAVSFFMIGFDVYRYPPFMITLFDNAYSRTGYHHPPKGADEAVLYEHALGFLDRFIEEAFKRDLELRHRLDAQSLVWMILNTDPSNLDGLAALAAELLLPVEFLEKIDTLLKEKSQVIFQGPPGTGKTYVAQKLATCLAGSEERVTLVQFHPSYAYEDFVQGFRPTLTGGGQPGFKLTDGPLLSAAKRARDEEEEDHFLVIDEINRGNLAKVLGELYFLLEYRDRKMRLQYQAEDDEDFSLPENLYIIGTMNTADRSIALVDLALRRRFHFVEFHPDHEPIKGLLHRWLDGNAPGMEWVADVVEQANRKLADDRHVAIGPSYFMVKNSVLDKAAVERIWEHNVLPYIEEHLFGNPDGLDEWNLDALKKQVKAQGHKSHAAEDKADKPTDASD